MSNPKLNKHQSMVNHVSNTTHLIFIITYRQIQNVKTFIHRWDLPRKIKLLNTS